MQIGNAITEKKVLDVILQARDRGPVHARSPTAAPAGFSPPSARWAPRSAPTVDLDKAPLKYDGLSYTEIWISEAQERMVLSRAAGELAASLKRSARARTSKRRCSARSRPPAG